MSLAEQVGTAFDPGGTLAHGWPGWEERGAQRALACDVARTLEWGGVLVAEAPTGIGKSLAYLLPSVLHALETEARIVIATCTRSLQDQLFERDLPAVLDVLGAQIRVARLKGKQNYLCPRALELASAEGDEEQDVLDALRTWSATEESGDLDRFDAADAEAYRRVRPRVAADPSACSAAGCRRGRECFWVRARRRAAEARITIVNHALLARAADMEGLLPEHDVLVIDEAHRLEGVLVSQLEKGVSRHRLDELLRLTGSLRGGRRAGGLLAHVRSLVLPLLHEDTARERVFADLERLSSRAEESRAAADALFAAFAPAPDRASGPYGARVRYRSAAELLGRDLQPLQVVLEHCTAFGDALRRAAAAVAAAEAGRTGEELQGELDTIASRWTALHDDLAELADAARSDWVYWRATRPGRGGSTELRGSPVHVGDWARRQLLGRPRSVVLTSATLSAGGDFSWSAERLGLGEDVGLPYEAITVPSPFPLARQMRTWIYESEGAEAEAVVEVVAALADAAPRNVLVLFTAHERLRRARSQLLSRLPEHHTLMAQDIDGPAGLLVERFRETRGAVLLGVLSLWEGVDFPGEALEVLVVAKLPFSVPDDPVVEARGERLRERGLEPFRHDSVPEAVVRFRQGVGRLIRRSDDRGVLVVCDPRLATAGYRRPFLEALPSAPLRSRDAHALARDAARFLEAVPATVAEDT